MGSKKKKNRSKKQDSSKGMDALLAMRDKLPKGSESNSIKRKQQPEEIKQQPDKARIVKAPPKEKKHPSEKQFDSRKKKEPPYWETNKQEHKRRPFDDNRNRRDYNNRYPLPKDVNQCLERAEDAVTNASLVLHRFVPWSTSEWKIEKNKVWQEIEQKANDIIQKSNQAVSFLKRQETLLKSLRSTVGANQVAEIKAESISKLSIGFGNSTPLETGLTLPDKSISVYKSN